MCAVELGVRGLVVPGPNDEADDFTVKLPHAKPPALSLYPFSQPFAKDLVVSSLDKQCIIVHMV